VSLRVLSGRDVERLLSMADCMDAVGHAMAALSGGRALVPPRIVATAPGGRGVLGLMPGATLEPEALGAKIGTIYPGNTAAGRKAIQGIVCLFDPATGAPAVVLDATTITTLRTAAASGLATRLLARADSRTHGIFGTGALVPAHIDAVQAARPQITRVLIWGRDAGKARALARLESARTGCDVRAVDEPAEAAACDVVTTVTAASQPVVRGRWLAGGAHLNLVGAHRPDDREADTEAITRGSVYVDSLDAALREAGELLIPIAEGALRAEQIVGEIGALASGAIAGRTRHDAITVYKSLGTVVQDLFVADRVARLAVAVQAGQTVPF
jgi:ornithine cyclodeaminase